MKKEDLIEVANSFKTFDKMFDQLKVGDFSFLNRKCGTIEYPEIEWMIEYFTKTEEYEKCLFLSKLELPKPSNDKLNSELEWLKLNT
ncbi:MAG: hypothetical protein IT215_02570 [Chitinophagaceae bacterium]|nr:hypothetical protein [Chitinophagaceae bacterium]